MKITLGQLKAAEPALKKLLNMDLPVSVSYKLAKLATSVDAELVTYETARVKLVKKFGKEDDQGNTNVTDENIPSFAKEINKLHAVEVDLGFEPISIDDLGTDVKMTPFEMSALQEFFI